MGPGPYYILYTSDCNFIVDGEDSSVIAGEHGQHWGGGGGGALAMVGMVGDRVEWGK